MPNAAAQLPPRPSLLLSRRATRLRRVLGLAGEACLFLVTSLSLLAVLFIFYFIVRDSLPFLRKAGLGEFLGSVEWYPSKTPPAYGALSMVFGSALVTFASALIAVPLGVCAAVCLSDILPFSVRQVAKPVVEVLASIPSVAFGFFALVIFAPFLQDHGNWFLAVLAGSIGVPLVGFGAFVASDLLAAAIAPEWKRARAVFLLAIGLGGAFLLFLLLRALSEVDILSGTNALNASIMLALMALPTIVSVSEDALQSVGVEMRMASYGLGATRAETMFRVVVPAASSGICAAVLLGIMRAVGETMVVWMASGNAAQIPTPWYDLTTPVRTLTATIAGDMGETAWGSPHYHCLFAMALALLLFCFACNLVSERAMKRNRRRLKGA